MALLKVIANLTTKLGDLVTNLHNIQNVAYQIRNTDYGSFKGVCVLGAVTSKGCESLVTLVSKFGGKATEKASAPVARKVTTEIAKKTFRFVGTVAVGLSIIADVVNIVDSVKALKEGQLSDAVAGIFTAINDMEEQVLIFDKVFAFTA
jgi:hypothetical protein